MADATPVAAPKNCGVCAYSSPSHHGEPDTIECRRYAPQPSFFARNVGETSAVQMTPMWPILAADEWCGEFK